MGQMETAMITSFVRPAAVLALAMLGAVGLSPDADARGGKEYFQQTYRFDRPMDGYQGFSGAYHCSYVRTPKQICHKGTCKRVWELLQTCQ